MPIRPKLPRELDAAEDDVDNWVKGSSIEAYWEAWRNIRMIKPPPDRKEDDDG